MRPSRDRKSRHARRSGYPDGPSRLLRALVRGGLPKDALPVAAALVLALDAEASFAHKWRP